jgi:hypothetical protein
VTSGKSQYIIPIADGNHTMKSRHSATPTHRWIAINHRLALAAAAIYRERTDMVNSTCRGRPGSAVSPSAFQ